MAKDLNGCYFKGVCLYLYDGSTFVSKNLTTSLSSKFAF
jgi:hypothetical protein